MKNLFALALCVLVLGGVGCGSSGPVREAAEIDVPALMEQLRSSDASARELACIELSKGLETAAPALDALIELVKSDKESRVREMAAYAIYEMGPEVGKAAMPMIKERWEKERSQGVRSVLLNLWNQIEPDSSPVNQNRAKQP